MNPDNRPLEILMLGAPEVCWQGQPWSIQRRLPRALLFYLAERRKVGRGELYPLLWNDDSAADQQAGLRETISRLRKELPNPDLLHTEDDLLYLDPQQTYVDVHEFQALLQKANATWTTTPIHEPLSAAAFGAIQAAVQLWRGRHFMAGVRLPDTVGMDHWLVQTGLQLDNMRTRILERLADHYETCGDLDRALHLLLAAVEDDETNEAAHSRVLNLHHLMGHRQLAIAHYKRVVKALKREGLEPDVNLVRAYEQVRSGRAASVSSLPPGGNWELHATLPAPFIGRQTELNSLNKAVGSGGTVFIWGPSGVGKTRLLQEFTQQFQPHQRLIRARCRPTESDLPLQPIIDMARQDIINDDDWLRLPANWARHILPLLPELANSRSDLWRPTEAVHGLARAQVFEAGRQMALQMAWRHRLTLVIEDAHWADEMTLNLIAYLSERPPFDRQGLLIVTACTDVKHPQLDQVWQTLKDRPQVSALPLYDFHVAEVAELVQQVTGRSAAPGFVDQLFHHTGGNPLFVLATLRDLPDNDQAPDLTSPTPLPVPTDIQALIRRRLHALSEPSYSFLQAAAMVGLEFNPATVGLALQMSKEAVDQALDELIAVRLIDDQAPKQAPGRYRFCHNTFRETSLAELRPSLAKKLQGRVAQALESSVRNSLSLNVRQLAEQFEAAEIWEKAFTYWLQAAQRARQLSAIAEAMHALARAEQVLHHAGERFTDEQIYQLYTFWASLAYQVEDHATLNHLGQAMHAWGQQRNSPLLCGAALVRKSDASLAANRFAAGLQLADQAVAQLAQTDHLPEKIRAQNARGVFLYMQNRWKEAFEVFQNTLALGADATEPAVRHEQIETHYQSALAHTLNGWPDLGRTHAQAALELAQALQESYGLSAPYSILTLANIFLGNFTEAQEAAAAGLELAERHETWRIHGYLHIYAGMAASETGHLGRAYHHARQAIELGEKYRHSEINAAGYRLLGDLYLLLNALPLARQYYERSLATNSEGFLSADALFRLGYVLYRLGETNTGATYLRQVSREARQNNLGLGAILAELYLAAAHLWTGDWQTAGEMAAYLETEAHQRALYPCELRASHLLAYVALQNGDLITARQRFQNIIEQSLRINYPWLKIYARLGLLSVEGAAGAPQTASHMLENHQRIQNQLKQLESHLESDAPAELSQAFQGYRQAILEWEAHPLSVLTA